MRSDSIVAVLGATSVALLASFVSADSQVHASVARRHMHHHHSKREGGLMKRAGTCEFPKDAGLVAVTPGEQNAGWALSPDQPCKPGMYCPYACPPGQLMNQWDPSATTYSYPKSQNGGLYCNEDGVIEKPFPNKPLCVSGTGTIGAINEAGGSVAICQTVLPGNEAMLIPTNVQSTAGLAVPDESYWASTAAHYYINPPGVSPEEGCVWGTKEQPVGNWAPYVAGANTVDGDTFVKIGWNPIYIEPDVPFRNERPDWGVRIECDGGGCNGLPCEIDPAVHAVNQLSQDNASGAGGANFCVVTVPAGSHANIVTFQAGGGSGGGSGGDEDEDEGEDEDKDEDKDEDEEDDDEPAEDVVVPSKPGSTKVKSPEKTSVSSSSEKTSQTSTRVIAKPTPKPVQKGAVKPTLSSAPKTTPWVGKKSTNTASGSKPSSGPKMKAASLGEGDDMSLLSTSGSGAADGTSDSTLQQPDGKRKQVSAGVKISGGLGLLCTLVAGAAVLLI